MLNGLYERQHISCWIILQKLLFFVYIKYMTNEKSQNSKTSEDSIDASPNPYSPTTERTQSELDSVQAAPEDVSPTETEHTAKDIAFAQYMTDSTQNLP